MLWQFLDLFYRTSSAQGVMHHLSQIRKLLNKVVLLNYVSEHFYYRLNLSKMRVKINENLNENLRLTNKKENRRRKKKQTKKDGKYDKRILHISCQLIVMFFIFSLILWHKTFTRKDETDITCPKPLLGATWIKDKNNHINNIKILKNFVQFS